jgi:hypothetical protein
MYVRTSRAATWCGPDDPSVEPPAYRADGVHPREVSLGIKWAKTPFMSRRHGRCVALRNRDNQILVGVAGSPRLLWLPLDRVLSDAEVSSWLRSGF